MCFVRYAVRDGKEKDNENERNVNMRSIVLGTLGAIAVALVLYILSISLYFLIGYCMQRKELKITMDSFMSFYVIAPENWELNEMFVYYKKKFYRMNGFAFSFNLIDTIKYERWRKRKERREEKQRKTDKYVTRYSEAMQCISDDISEFARQNDALIEKAVSEMLEQDKKIRG